MILKSPTFTVQFLEVRTYTIYDISSFIIFCFQHWFTKPLECTNYKHIGYTNIAYTCKKFCMGKNLYFSWSKIFPWYPVTQTTLWNKVYPKFRGTFLRNVYTVAKGVDKLFSFQDQRFMRKKRGYAKCFISKAKILQKRSHQWIFLAIQTVQTWALPGFIIIRHNVYYEQEIIPAVYRLFSTVIGKFWPRQLRYFRKKLFAQNVPPDT